VIKFLSISLDFVKQNLQKVNNMSLSLPKNHMSNSRAVAEALQTLVSIRLHMRGLGLPSLSKEPIKLTKTIEKLFIDILSRPVTDEDIERANGVIACWVDVMDAFKASVNEYVIEKKRRAFEHNFIQYDNGPRVVTTTVRYVRLE